MAGRDEEWVNHSVELMSPVSIQNEVQVRLAAPFGMELGYMRVDTASNTKLGVKVVGFRSLSTGLLGSAEQSGLIHVGDEITTVNDEPLSEIPFDAAVAVLHRIAETNGGAVFVVNHSPVSPVGFKHEPTSYKFPIEIQEDRGMELSDLGASRERRSTLPDMEALSEMARSSASDKDLTSSRSSKRSFSLGNEPVGAGTEHPMRLESKTENYKFVPLQTTLSVVERFAPRVDSIIENASSILESGTNFFLSSRSPQVAKLATEPSKNDTTPVPFNVTGESISNSAKKIESTPTPNNNSSNGKEREATLVCGQKSISGQSQSETKVASRMVKNKTVRNEQESNVDVEYDLNEDTLGNSVVEQEARGRMIEANTKLQDRINDLEASELGLRLRCKSLENELQIMQVESQDALADQKQVVEKLREHIKSLTENATTSEGISEESLAISKRELEAAVVQGKQQIDALYSEIRLKDKTYAELELRYHDLEQKVNNVEHIDKSQQHLGFETEMEKLRLELTKSEEQVRSLESKLASNDQLESELFSLRESKLENDNLVSHLNAQIQSQADQFGKVQNTLSKSQHETLILSQQLEVLREQFINSQTALENASIENSHKDKVIERLEQQNVENKEKITNLFDTSKDVSIELRESLEQKSREMSEIQSRFAEVESREAQLQQLVKEQEKQLENVQLNLVQKLEELKESEKRYDELKQQQQDILDETIQKLETQHEQAQSHKSLEFDALQVRFREIADELDRVKSDSKSDTQLENLSQRCATLESELEAEKNRSRQFLEQQEVLQNNFDARFEEMNVAAKKSSMELVSSQQRVEELKEVEVEVRGMVMELQDKLERTERDLSSKVVELQDAQNELKSVQDAFTKERVEHAEEIQRFEGLRAELSKRITELEVTKEQLETRVNLSESQVESLLESQKKHFEMQNTNQKRRNSLWDEEKKSMHDKLLKSKETIDKLQKKLIEMEHSNQVAKETLATVNRDKEAVEAKLGNLELENEREIKRVQTSNSDLTLSLSLQQQETRTLNAEVGMLREQIKELQDELLEEQTRYQNLKQQLDDSLEVQHKLEEQLRSPKQDQSKEHVYQSQIRELEEELSRFKSNFDEQRSFWQSEKENYEKQLQDQIGESQRLESKARDLNKQLSTQTGTCEMLNSMCTQLEKDYESLKTKHDEQHREIEMSKITLSTRNADIEKLEGLMAHSEEQNKKLMNALAQMQQVGSSEFEAYEALLKTHSEIKEKYEVLFKSHSEVKDKYEALLTTHTEVKNKYEALLTTHTEVKDKYEALLTTHTEVKNKYEALLTTHTEVKDKYEALLTTHTEMTETYRAESASRRAQQKVVSELEREMTETKQVFLDQLEQLKSNRAMSRRSRTNSETQTSPRMVAIQTEETNSSQFLRGILDQVCAEFQERERDFREREKALEAEIAQLKETKKVNGGEQAFNSRVLALKMALRYLVIHRERNSLVKKLEDSVAVSQTSSAIKALSQRCSSLEVELSNTRAQLSNQSNTAPRTLKHGHSKSTDGNVDSSGHEFQNSKQSQGSQNSMLRLISSMEDTKLLNYVIDTRTQMRQYQKRCGCYKLAMVLVTKQLRLLRTSTLALVQSPELVERMVSVAFMKWRSETVQTSNHKIVDEYQNVNHSQRGVIDQHSLPTQHQWSVRSRDSTANRRRTFDITNRTQQLEYHRRKQQQQLADMKIPSSPFTPEKPKRGLSTHDLDYSPRNQEWYPKFERAMWHGSPNSSYRVASQPPVDLSFSGSSPRHQGAFGVGNRQVPGYFVGYGETGISGGQSRSSYSGHVQRSARYLYFTRVANKVLDAHQREQKQKAFRRLKYAR